MRITIQGTFDNQYTQESGDKELIIDVYPDHYEIQIGDETVLVMKTNLELRFPKL